MLLPYPEIRCWRVRPRKQLKMENEQRVQFICLTCGMHHHNGAGKCGCVPQSISKLPRSIPLRKSGRVSGFSGSDGLLMIGVLGVAQNQISLFRKSTIPPIFTSSASEPTLFDTRQHQLPSHFQARQPATAFLFFDRNSSLLIGSPQSRTRPHLLM